MKRIKQNSIAYKTPQPGDSLPKKKVNKGRKNGGGRGK